MMDLPAMITGICPKCLKTVQVPEDLDRFCCIYCGARLGREELLSEKLPVQTPVTPQEAQSAFARLDQQLVFCVTENLNIFKKLTKNGFPDYFEGFLQKNRPLFESIPIAAQASADALEQLSRGFVDKLDAWSENSRRGLNSVEAMRDDAKYTLCLLLIPAIRQLDVPEGERLCTLLREAWLERHPKSPFQLTTYEHIMSGFRRRWCFITTATCRQAGKSDDCPELTAFRSFRDGYLHSQPDGEALIREYYEIAPAIVLAIDLTDHPDTVYPDIWDRHLSHCYDALNRGDCRACKELYTQMVHDLAEKYLRS